MTTIRDLVQQARRTAYGSMTETVNLIRGGYTPGTKELDLELDVQGISPGMIVSAGLNVWHVIGVDVPLKRLTVIEAWDGSKNDPLPGDEVVYVRPRVTDWHLFTLINEEITGLSSSVKGLYRVHTETLTARYSPYAEYHLDPSLTFEMESVLKVQVRPPYGQDTRWVDVPARTYRVNSTPQGASLRFLEDYAPHMGEVKVFYKSRFRAAQSLSDDPITNCGLTDTMLDIPALGAAVSLLRTTESRRTQIAVQGDPRRADEVPPGSNSSAARELQREYQSRIDEERIRLTNLHPLVMAY